MSIWDRQRPSDRRQPTKKMTAAAQALALVMIIAVHPALHKATEEGTLPCSVEYVCSCATLSEQEHTLLSAEVKGNRCAPASHPEHEVTTVWLCGNAVLEAELYDDLWLDACEAHEIPCGVSSDETWSPTQDPVVNAVDETAPAVAPVYAWSLGPWSTCSRACGGGGRHRDVHCRQILPVTPGEAALYVDSAHCQGLLPAAEEACNTHACFFCSVPNPCNKNGKCVAADPMQRKPAHCSCSPGWAGDRCQTAVNAETMAAQPCGGNSWDADGNCCHSKLKDVLGACCPANSTQLDGQGQCCDLELDACGVCGGLSKTVDMAGHCCPPGHGLDAAGGCCAEDLIDSCGVCNGKGLSCSIRIQLGLQLHTQKFFQSATNILEAVNPKQELTNEITKLLDLGLGSVADVSHAQLLVAAPINNSTTANIPEAIKKRLAGMENGSLMNYFAEVGLPPAGLKYGEVTALMVHNILTELELVLNSAPVNETDGERQIQIGDVEMVLVQMMALGRVSFTGTCGNSICEIGESGGGRTSSSGNAPVCPQDCPKWTVPSPPPTCSGNGRWIAVGDGGCDCFTGYMGLRCETCWLGWERLSDSPSLPCAPSNLIYAQLSARSSSGVGPSNSWVLNPPQEVPSTGSAPGIQGPALTFESPTSSGGHNSAGLMAGLIIAAIAIAGALVTMFVSAHIRKRKRAHILNMAHLEAPDLSTPPAAAPQQEQHEDNRGALKRFRASLGSWFHTSSPAEPAERYSYPGADVIFGTPPMQSEFDTPSDATPAQLAAQVRSTKSDFNVYPQTPAAAAELWGAQLSQQSSATSSQRSGELSVTSCETPQSQPVGLYASDTSAMSPWTPRGELGFLRSKLAQATPKSPYSTYGSSNDSGSGGSKTPKAGLTPRSLQFNFASPRLTAKSIRKKFRLDAPVDKADKGKQPEGPGNRSQDSQNGASTSSAIDSLPFPTYIKDKLPESMPWADSSSASSGASSPRSLASPKRPIPTPTLAKQPQAFLEARTPSHKLTRFGALPSDTTSMAYQPEPISPRGVVVEPWMTGDRRPAATKTDADNWVSPLAQQAGVQPLNLSKWMEDSESPAGSPERTPRSPSPQAVQPVNLFAGSSSDSSSHQLRTPAPVKTRPQGQRPHNSSSGSPYIGAARLSTPSRGATTPGGSSIAHLGIRPVHSRTGSIGGDKPLRISTPKHKSTKMAAQEPPVAVQTRQEGLLGAYSTPRATRTGVRSNPAPLSEVDPAAETYSVVLSTPSGMSRQELMAKLQKTGIRPDQMELPGDSAESMATSYENPSFEADSPSDADMSASGISYPDEPLQLAPSLPVSTRPGHGDEDCGGETPETVTPESAPSP